MSEEREINLLHLVYMILCKWKIITMWMVVCGVLAAGAKTFFVYKSYTAAMKDENFVSYVEQLEIYEKTKNNLRSEIEALRTNIDEKQNYLDESVYINLDANSVYLGRLTYNIIVPKTENDEYDSTLAYNIGKAYWGRSIDGKSLYNIEKLYPNIDDKYLRELIAVGVSVTNNGYIALDVTIRGTDTQMAETIKNEIKSICNAEYDSIYNEYGKHTLDLVYEDVYCSTDNGLTNNRKTYVDDMQNTRRAISDKEKELDKLLVPSNNGDYSQITVTKEIIKYSIIGLIAGICISVCFYVIKYLLSDYILDEDELSANKLEVIALAYSKPSNKINAAFYSILKIGKKENKTDKFEELAAAVICNMKTNNVVLVGDVEEEKIKKIAGLVRCEYLIDIVNDAETIGKLSMYDDIVFIKKRHFSKRTVFINEYKKLKLLNKNIIGVVLY